MCGAKIKVITAPNVECHNKCLMSLIAVSFWLVQLLTVMSEKKFSIVGSFVLKGARGPTGKPGPVGHRGKPASIQL